jgi:microcystin-dependent protein
VARDLYQKTFTVIDSATSMLKPASGIQVFVFKPGTEDPVDVYEARTGSTKKVSTGQPILSSSSGLVEFYAEAGEYDIKTSDSQVPARVAERTVSWNSTPMADGGIPSAKIAGDGALDYRAMGPVAVRQDVPIGGCMDWFRPVPTIPKPAGFEYMMGQVIPANQHDFGTGQSIQLPDLRNAYTLGANPDSTKAQNAAGTVTSETAAGAPGVGGTGGQMTVTLTESQMPSHNHPLSDPGHAHNTYNYPLGSAYPELVEAQFVLGGGWGFRQVGGTSGAVTGITLSPTGGGQYHSNQPRYVGLIKIVKLRRA